MNHRKLRIPHSLNVYGFIRRVKSINRFLLCQLLTKKAHGTGRAMGREMVLAKPSGFDKIQGNRIDAIAQACWFGPIFEDMTKMSFAAAAVNFVAN